jgi:hypothetical protein
MPGPTSMDDEDEDNEPISLGSGGDWDGPNLGPDEHDRDLMDGSWEQRYYQGRTRKRDWTGIMTGLGLLVLLGMVLPAILLFFR